ncbi:unnamed protein product [Linum trigynum]|uniref:Uncharacterized protein n=1 Tax=Linum trigynum TaxID=586398 RepID=A0AAV2ENM9_9ROSI
MSADIVIVLHWSSTSKSSDSCNGGQLFIYGGVETGSDKVLTIVTLEWSSSKAERLKCAGHMDLITLTGSFADMIVLPNGGSSAMDNQHKAALTVLTSPGQLHRFDGASLSSLLSHQDRKAMAISLVFPAIVPTVGPPMTAARFIALPMHTNSLKLSSGVGLAKKRSSNSVAASPKERSIGTLSHSTESIDVERVYIAGYQDGSVSMQGLELVAFGAPVTSILGLLLGHVAIGSRMKPAFGLLQKVRTRESKLKSNLNIKWNFKDKMEKIMSCDSGHIALYTLTSQDTAITSFSHDKVLAAATFKVSFNQKKKQDTTKPGILRCLAKSFKGCKPYQNLDASHLRCVIPTISPILRVCLPNRPHRQTRHLANHHSQNLTHHLFLLQSRARKQRSLAYTTL